MLKTIYLIASRDFKSYFTTPIAYMVLSVFLGLLSFMFFNLLSMFVQESSYFSQMGVGAKPSVTNHILRPLFGNMNVILLFVAPFITMRLLSEERKEQTAALLITAPIHPFSIILGKFFSAFAMIMVMLLGSFIYPLILMLIASPDIGTIVASYLGLILLVSTYIALGLFWSACTENQIVAAAMSFGSLLFLWLIGWAGHRAGPIWSEVLQHLSILGQFTNFSQGIIDTTNVFYYLSMIAFALFLAHTSFDTNQWRSE